MLLLLRLLLWCVLLFVFSRVLVLVLVLLETKTNLPEIAFLGRSNVGKSSMLNTLFGESVAKVSKTPGRTRQINIFKVTMLLHDHLALLE